MHKIIIFFLAFFLIGNFANANNIDDQLIYRASSGSAVDVKILLEQGADPNAKNSINRPVLIIAAARNHPDSAKIVRDLVEKGANFSAVDTLGENAFTAAIASGTLETVEYLLTLKPSYKIKNGLGEDLPAIAKKRQDTEIYALVDKLKKAEVQDWTQKTSGSSRQKLFKDFAFKSCVEEYLIFYYSNDAEPEFNPDIYDQKMLKIANDINATLADLKKYFSLTRAELNRVEALSRKSISTQLAEMGSSNYRLRAGVGTDADLQKRCGKIALDISLRTSIKRKATSL